MIVLTGLIYDEGDYGNCVGVQYETQHNERDDSGTIVGTYTKKHSVIAGSRRWQSLADEGATWQGAAFDFDNPPANPKPDSILLAEAQASKSVEIEKNTVNVVARGMTYDSRQFSISDTAVRHAQTMWEASRLSDAERDARLDATIDDTVAAGGMDAATATYLKANKILVISTMDAGLTYNMPYASVGNFAEKVLGARNVIDLAEATLLRSVLQATTAAEVEAIEDTR